MKKIEILREQYNYVKENIINEKYKESTIELKNRIYGRYEISEKIDYKTIITLVGIQTNEILEFETRADVAKYLNVSKQAIESALHKNKVPQTKGFFIFENSVPFIYEETTRIFSKKQMRRFSELRNAVKCRTKGENNPEYIYKTYNDCTMDSNWEDLDLFIEDLKQIPGYDEWFNNPGQRIALDKDIKIPGNKHYSKDTCMFVSASENAKESMKRSWEQGKLNK